MSGENGSSKREHWSGNLGFILAAAGSAVGLGNIWKFPYITGEHGGGAFVLIYLLCIVVIGLPVMLCEITLGRKTQRNPVGAFMQLSPKSSASSHFIGFGLLLVGIALLCFQSWGMGVLCLLVGATVFLFSWTVVGVMGVLSGFVILSFYSVVAGWTIGYTIKTLDGSLTSNPKEQKTEILAQVYLNQVKKTPEAVSEKIDSDLKDDKINLIQAQRDKEVASQKAAIAAAKDDFKVDIAFPKEELISYDFSDYFQKELSGKVEHDKLLNSLTNTFGGMKTKKVGDETIVEYPKEFEKKIGAAHFGVFSNNPYCAIGFHFLFMLLCVGIVCLGVQKGIERASKILMPTLLLLIAALIIRGITLDGAIEGVRFYLNPDFSKLNPDSVLQALGHAFFSLSLGMGAMITYGSYVNREENLFVSALSITCLDTLIALLAGLAIFPAVFAQGFAPDQGPGLVFHILPAVFNQMPGGMLWAFLFFMLLLVAALTSGISLLEVVTAYLVDELKWSRKKAAILIGSIIFIVGAFAAVSVDNWERLVWMQSLLISLFGSARASCFDVLDNLGSNWLLPLGGLFISIFVGWIWGTKKAVEEIRHGSSNFADVHLIALLSGLKDDPSHNSDHHVLTLASIWGIFIRFVSPVAVMIAFLHTVGWLKF